MERVVFENTAACLAVLFLRDDLSAVASLHC